MNDAFNSRNVHKIGNKEYIIYRLDALEKATLALERVAGGAEKPAV